MTRDEAIYQALALEHPPGSVVPCLSVEQGTELQRLARKHAEVFVDRLVAFGLLKLELPLSPEGEARKAMLKELGPRFHPSNIDLVLRVISDAGFKIVKA